MSFASIGAAGSNQGDATAITTNDVVVTGADGTKGVRLPADGADITIVLQNNGGAGGTNALSVYPPSGAKINQGADDAAISIPGSSAAIFRRITTNVWICVRT